MPIEDFGPDIRIEQRFAPVRPLPRNRYNRNKAGNPITDNAINLDAEGKPIWAWVLYRRTPVSDGIHPWHGEPTALTEVWMPLGEFNSVEDARAAAKAEQEKLGSKPKKGK
jgi:hypothetical protein